MAKRAKKSRIVKGNGQDHKQAIAREIKVAHFKCTLLGAQLVKESQKIKGLVAESGRHVDRESTWAKWLETECGISLDMLAVYLALGSTGSSVASFFSRLASLDSTSGGKNERGKRGGIHYATGKVARNGVISGPHRRDDRLQESTGLG